ncbi:MAG TPA: hypothetical protein VFD71_12660 [Planctomycetota bacterium]|nr:hypothetical protein [Planctomycetota bacterium]
MGPSIVLEWLAVDDRLRSAIIASSTDSESAASPSPPHRTRRTPPTCPSQFSVSAFRLAGRGVF